MLKFAICDDLTTEANTLKNHIERYAREKSLRVEIDAYSEARPFLRCRRVLRNTTSCFSTPIWSA